MSERNHEIIFLEPIFTHNIWGGSRLREEFHYPVEGDDIGECWGIAAHPKGDCRVRDGAFAGKRLSWLWQQEPGLFGHTGGNRFPLLVKIIDAKDDLSIQVHPDDAYAKLHEQGSLGKTECWYVMECPKGASLVVGHNAGSKEELAAMIRQGRWRELIREIPVKKGDFIQIDPGTVHAIKGGMMILETQQNSDITYRLYDYGRQRDGKMRELHIEKSMDVITVPAKPASDSVMNTGNAGENVLYPLYACGYYQVFLLKLKREASFGQVYPFLLMSVLEGEGALNGQPVKKGDHLILPADFGRVEAQGNFWAVCSTI